MQLTHVLFSLKGRINRVEFLFGSIVAILIAGFFLFLPMFFSSNSTPESGVSSFKSIATMTSYVLGFLTIVYVKMISLTCKRLRDMDFSVWCILLFLIPGLNFLYILLYFYPGKKLISNNNLDFALEPLEKFRF